MLANDAGESIGVRSGGRGVDSEICRAVAVDLHCVRLCRGGCSVIDQHSDVVSADQLVSAEITNYIHIYIYIHIIILII